MINRQALLQAAIFVLLFNLGQMVYQNYFGTVGALTEISSMPSQVVATPVSSAGGKERFVTVKTDKMKVYIDTHGGRVARVSLTDYPNDNGDVTFFDDKGDEYLDAQMGYVGDKKLTFKAGRRHYQATNGGEVTVRLSATNPQGLQYTKIFTFKSDSYAIEASASVLNKTGERLAIRPYYVFSGDKKTSLDGKNKAPTPKELTFDADSEGMIAAVKGYSGISYPTSKKDYVRQDFSKISKGIAPTSVRGGWVAFQKHHFISAWVMDTNKQFTMSDYWLEGESEAGSGVYEQKFVTQALGAKETMEEGGLVSSHSRLYVGPQIKENLMALSPTLKLTMDYGFFWTIANILAVCLNSIHKVVPSWGWSLIIVVVLTRIVLYPSTKQQVLQAVALKKIQPEREKIDKKYAGKGSFDLEKHEALTELYKKHNIKIGFSSMIIPLLQVPLFIAYYGVISVSPEFRGASFLWIKDMAVSDPFYILPVVAVLFLFLQSEDSEISPDFKMLMRFLPIMFALLVIRLPASLQLYAALNTALQVMQTKVLKKN